MDYNLFLFLNRLFFREVFDLQQKWVEDTEIFHILLPHTCIASLIINIAHQSGTLVAIDDPALTH